MLGNHIPFTETLHYVGNMVSLSDFCNYVKRMHEDRDEQFEIEYAVSIYIHCYIISH